MKACFHKHARILYSIDYCLVVALILPICYQYAITRPFHSVIMYVHQMDMDINVLSFNEFPRRLFSHKSEFAYNIDELN